MKVKEFKMLVHGPFATNTYLDLGDLEDLKKLSLSKIEIEILEYIKKRPKTEKKIIEQFLEFKKYSSNQVQNALKNLKSHGYVEFKGIIWDEITERHQLKTKNLSPTINGYNELKTIEKFRKLKRNVSFDKNILTNFLSNTTFENVKREDSTNSYKQFGSHFFSNEVQAHVLAKFTIQNLIRTISSSTSEIELRFMNNTIHIFASGIGIFSSQITITFTNEVDIAEIDHTYLEKEVRKEIDNIFKVYIGRVVDQLSKDAEDCFQLVRGLFDFDASKVANLAWLHTIYWFYDDRFFKDDEIGLRNLDHVFLKYFTAIMEQRLDNPLDIQDHYVFYGLDRSLVLTSNDEHHNLNRANEIGTLIEIGQYFCFGLNLLEYFLSRKVSQLMVDEPVIEQNPNKLKDKIESIERTRSASARYLEQFRSGIKALIHEGQIALVDKLENGWRLQSLQDNILVKLHSLEKELSSREQSLLAHKQDRFSNIAFVFTVISLASVMGGVVALSPLKDQFQTQNTMIFFSSELFFVLFSTTAVIAATMYLVMKSYGLRQKIRSIGEKFVRRTYTEREVKNRYTKKIDNSSKLYKDEEKEVLLKYRDQIKEEINALYKGGRMNKTILRDMESKLDSQI